MKLKLKIFLISLGFTITLCATLTVILEYSMSMETKKEIELAEKAKLEEIERQNAIEAEAKEKEESVVELLKKYDKVEDYYGGLALVKKDDKYGYVDFYGKEVIPLQFDVANNFTNKTYAKVKIDDKWGYIDNTGKQIIPVEYAYCGEVSNGIVAVGNGGKYGFISIAGKTICDLIYDKVEPFNENGHAKVVIDQKYGLIDTKGVEIVAITNDYVEENYDFTGEWKQTNIHSSKAGTIIVTGQIATSFNFEIKGRYFIKDDTISGTAEIIKPNVAEYKYNNGELSDTLTFSIIDGNLNVTAKNGGSCGMENGITAIGTYTLDVPKYTNDKVLTKVFEDNEKLFERIKNVLGEDIYSEYFLYGFRNGEYKISELDEVSDVIKGTLYTVTIPTMERDFKLLISKDNIYFFAKTKEIYKTDDEARQSIAKMPSAIAFDEL